MWPYIIIWCIVVIVSIIIEVASVSLTSIWFAIAGLVSLILAASGVDIVWQVLVFIVLSLILLFATRPLLKRFMDRNVIRTNADKVISMIGIVTKEIPVGDIGEVRVNSELWRAISLETTDIAINEKIIVNSLNGNKLLVSRIKKSEDLEIL